MPIRSLISLGRYGCRDQSRTLFRTDCIPERVRNGQCSTGWHVRNVNIPAGNIVRIQAEFVGTLNTSLAHDGDRLPVLNTAPITFEHEHSVQRPGLEPEVVHTPGNSVPIGINRSAGYINPRSVTVSNHIGLIDLRFKFQMQLVGTLRFSAVSTASDRWVVLVVATGRDPEVVNTFSKRSADPGILAKVVIVDLNTIQATALEHQRRERRQIEVFVDIGCWVANRDGSPENRTCEWIVIDRIYDLTRRDQWRARCGLTRQIENDLIREFVTGFILCPEDSH